MAHFAKLGVGNKVLKVEVVSNDIATTEKAGEEFLQNLYGSRDVWKQTSYNGNIRKNFAGIGYIYDQTRDAFIEPKPYDSWILNETTCIWEAPVTRPEITEEQLLEVTKKLNPYTYVRPRDDSGDDIVRLAAISHTNLQEDYIKRFLMTSMVGFIHRMGKEFQIDEEAPKDHFESLQIFHNLKFF